MKRLLQTILICYFFSANIFAQNNADALKLFLEGRALQDSGKATEATAKYQDAISVCNAELLNDPNRLESYVVKCWALFRLNRHQEVIQEGNKGLAISSDFRIIEQMGESYFFIGDYQNSLKFLQRYIEGVGDSGERGGTAYFYMGEVYVRLKKYQLADIAYTTAVTIENRLPRWWFRLGQAREAAGDAIYALEAYEKAISINPQYSDAITARNRLKP